MTRWPFLRDVALFIGGLGGVAHETLLAKAERPTLLILFAAMMGLPAFLQPRDISSATNTVHESKKEVKEENG